MLNIQTQKKVGHGLKDPFILRLLEEAFLQREEEKDNRQIDKDIGI
jgi:hypothetical protein